MALRRAAEAEAAGPQARRTEGGLTTFPGAIAEALWEEMERDERVFLLGTDLGASKALTGFAERFGPGRLVDLPGGADAIVGMAVGAALEGLRPVVQLGDAEVLTGAFGELVATAGPYHYRTGRSVALVVRAPYGGVRARADHAGYPEPWFAYAPGLKVICPAFPADAKGLLKSAIRDDDPCVFLEHRGIARQIPEAVPDDPGVSAPIGRAAVRRPGDHVTIVAYGAVVHRALEAAEDLAEEGVSAEVVDLRTIVPLDAETVLGSVAKTGRALVLYESHRFLGVGAEVAALIAEEGFQHLDAPVLRLAPPNTPVPFSPPLEDAFVPQVDDIIDAVKRLSNW